MEYCYAVIMIHLPNFVVQNGSTRSEASFLFTVIAIGTILSRLTVGLATGPNGLDPLLLNFGLTAFIGGSVHLPSPYTSLILQDL